MNNYDLTDEEYEKIKPLLLPERGRAGCPCKPHRPIINGILWVLCSGTSWRKMPKRYGQWGSVHVRYTRWKRDGTWQKIYNTLSKTRIKNQQEKKKKVSKKPKSKSTLRIQTIEKNIQEPLVSIEDWEKELSEVQCRLGNYFARSESRQQATSYLKGLLSPTKRKNSWQLAETNGDKNPYGIQYLISRARWSSDALRDELYEYAKVNLESPESVLVIDETGFLKKGPHSAGVARQYTGTAGRVENCQVGVFVNYATGSGHILLDRELYLPKEWTKNRVRCSKAGIPEDREFKTKPQLAQDMLTRIFATDIAVAWVAGDSVYGNNRQLRMFLQDNYRAYVLSVSGNEYVSKGGQQHKVNVILKDLPDQEWQRISVGDGAKGPRIYDWTWLPLESVPKPHWRQWLLVRRSISSPDKLTGYIVFAPQDTLLEQVVQVAGIRWTIETDFQVTKGEVGLDHYEVRSWNGWYRHITLAMWAYSLLAVICVKTSHDFDSNLKKNLLPIKRTIK